jgi:hypothetical protein
MSVAYCEFGLANPGLYQVMFANPLPLPEPATADQMPGRAAFQAHRDVVAAYLGGGEPSSPEAFHITLLIWQQLHGTVSLRISRPVSLAAARSDSDRRGQPPSRRHAPVGA